MMDIMDGLKLALNHKDYENYLCKLFIPITNGFVEGYGFLVKYSLMDDEIYSIVTCESYFSKEMSKKASNGDSKSKVKVELMNGKTMEIFPFEEERKIFLLPKDSGNVVLLQIPQHGIPEEYFLDIDFGFKKDGKNDIIVYREKNVVVIGFGADKTIKVCEGKISKTGPKEYEIKVEEGKESFLEGALIFDQFKTNAIAIQTNKDGKGTILGILVDFLNDVKKIFYENSL
ncbi:MAG: hypothetical protein MJ252_04290 [archaeon]|nr:hypothetical protein [archaeon]